MRDVGEEHKRPEDSSWLEEQIAFEALPENKIVVSIPPRRWHPDLLTLRDSLTATARRFATVLNAPAPKPRKASSRWEPAPVSYDDARRIENDGRLLVMRSRAHCLRVSLLTYERALAIANALLFAAEARRFEVGHDKEQGRLVLKRETAKFGIAIRERQETHNEPSYGSMIKRFEAKDRLFIFVERPSFSTFEMKDHADEPVQNQLNEFFCRLYPSVMLERQRGREDAARADKAARARVIYEEITRQRALDAQAKVDEDARREALVDEALKWRKAEDIRTYLSRLAEAGPLDQTWFRWAWAVADELDPSKRRMKEALEKGPERP